jgi:hypothetical protein
VASGITASGHHVWRLPPTLRVSASASTRLAEGRLDPEIEELLAAPAQIAIRAF